MPKAIWKYRIAITDEQGVDLPQGAEVLCVQDQYNTGDRDVSLWALVDTDAATQSRTVRIYGTGHPVPDNPGRYINTFIIRGGALVFHVFDASGGAG